MAVKNELNHESFLSDSQMFPYSTNLLLKGDKKIKDDSIVKLDLKNVSNCQLINNTNKITRSFMLVYFT